MTGETQMLIPGTAMLDHEHTYLLTYLHAYLNTITSRDSETPVHSVSSNLAMSCNKKEQLSLTNPRDAPFSPSVL